MAVAPKAVAPNREFRDITLPPQPRRERVVNEYRSCDLFVLVFILLNLSFNAYRSRHHRTSLAFVLFSYSDLLLLLFSVRRFEQLGDDRPEKKARLLKVAIWIQSTALTLGFSWRVAQVMPWGVAVAIWIMGGSVAVGGFYGLLL
ncbi:hypothetical protein Cni_G22826 [Canna indica]|uniref:Uncharacterized protein n=1 Tax=Canna indica TaxID=4628 RepID=A0AAQ3QIM5_9LILI|nr:hypothetical protein Cni_G22826 [Canna indica]